jgi:hypothetical protein
VWRKAVGLIDDFIIFITCTRTLEYEYISSVEGSRSSKEILERPDPMKMEYACSSSFSVAVDDFDYFGPAVIKSSNTNYIFCNLSEIYVINI